MKVAVIHGGTSTEASVSTTNASYVEQALLALGHEAQMVCYDQNMMETLLANPPDTVFLCVQGKYHGDGTLQGILERLGIPYTGSRREAATVINDKILCQSIFEKHHLPIPPNMTWDAAAHAAPTGKQDFLAQMATAHLTFPCVAKAPTQGGSFGIALLQSSDDYDKMAAVFHYDTTILIEQFIEGNFYTVGLLEYHGSCLALPVMQGIPIKSDQKVIVFTGNYTVTPANLPKELEAQLQAYAKKAYHCVHAKTYGRVDFILETATNTPYILEINAVPGIKPSSLFPPSAQLAGISYNEMIEAILLDSNCPEAHTTISHGAQTEQEER